MSPLVSSHLPQVEPPPQPIKFGQASNKEVLTVFDDVFFMVYEKLTTGSEESLIL